MSLIARLFGSLANELKKGIVPAVNYYEKMNTRMLKESVDDFEPFVEELLKYQNTTNAVHNLITFKMEHFNAPVRLPYSARPQLKLFTKMSLSARDMAGIDSAIHLFRNSLDDSKVPFRPVSCK